MMKAAGFEIADCTTHDRGRAALQSPASGAEFVGRQRAWPFSLAAKRSWRVTAIRWVKFNAVGGMGIVVQLIVLLLLKSVLQLNYLAATALAVESAVIHNFLWHERYTWADRVRPSWRLSWRRLLRFNVTNGGVSIVGNLALMRVMVGVGHMNYLLANGIAIALCSLLNFLVSDEWVFERQ